MVLIKQKKLSKVRLERGSLTRIIPEFDSWTLSNQVLVVLCVLKILLSGSIAEMVSNNWPRLLQNVKGILRFEVGIMVLGGGGIEERNGLQTARKRRVSTPEFRRLTMVRRRSLGTRRQSHVVVVFVSMICFSASQAKS